MKLRKLQKRGTLNKSWINRIKPQVMNKKGRHDFDAKRVVKKGGN